MLGGADQKALFDYWHDRVRLTNLNRLGAREHVTTQELRHECTNYDELRRLKPVQELDELERCRVIAIIKYECTAKVLQRRTGLLRDYARQCEEQALDHRQKERGLHALISKLKDILKGRDVKILRLESRIESLQAENEALRTEQQQSKAESQRSPRPWVRSLTPCAPPCGSWPRPMPGFIAAWPKSWAMAPPQWRNPAP